MTTTLIRELEQDQLKKELPRFLPGDTVRVFINIKEGDKERVQVFEGIVIGIKGQGLSTRITVYRVAYRQAMQKNFAVHSPNIVKIEIVRRGKVRRAKLTYLIGKTGKKARIREKIGAHIGFSVQETAESEEGTSSSDV